MRYKKQCFQILMMFSVFLCLKPDRIDACARRIPPFEKQKTMHDSNMDFGVDGLSDHLYKEIRRKAALSEGSGVSLLIHIQDSTDVLALAEFLEAHPVLRLSLMFDEGSLRGDNGQIAKTILKALASSGQVNLVMSIAGNPILPLIYNSELAKKSFGFGDLSSQPYQWSQDVMALVAMARGSFRRELGISPYWFFPPNGTFFLEGGLLSQSQGLFPLSGIKKIRRLSYWIENHSRKENLLNRLKLGGIWSFGYQSAEVFQVFSDLLESDEIQLFNLDDYSRSQSDFYLLHEASNAGSDRALLGDLSPWIGEPEENAAWRALGKLRQEVENYKNSGRADVKKLESAMAEIYAAYNGSYFDHYGKDKEDSMDGVMDQRFREHLIRSWRLIGWSAPEYLNSPLTHQEMLVSTTTHRFYKTSDSVRWEDPIGDDRGTGKYFYPNGRDYIPGSWDITSFEIRDEKDFLVVSVKMEKLSNPWEAPYGFSLPLIDVYMDANHRVGIGSDTALPGRKIWFLPEDAWEYVLTISGWGSTLWQHQPGGVPRKILSMPPKIDMSKRKIQVRIPREVFRGKPLGWGYSVLVMGFDKLANKGRLFSPHLPMSVLSEPTDYAFGVEHAEKGAPPILDTILPVGQDQSEVISSYLKGNSVVIPMVRP